MVVITKITQDCCTIYSAHDIWSKEEEWARCVCKNDDHKWAYWNLKYPYPNIPNDQNKFIQVINPWC